LKKRLRTLGFYFLRVFGGFKIARRRLRNNLLILCYHGISVYDEHEFYPGLFQTRETFRRRIELLAETGLPVLSLSDALNGLKNKTLPPGAVVLTFDDGWWGTYKHAIPELKQHDFPGTIYATTYYIDKKFPIYHLVIRYLFWKTNVNVVDFTGIDQRFNDVTDLRIGLEKDEAINNLLELGESRNADQRKLLLSKVATALEASYNEIQEQRLFRLMTFNEVHHSAEKDIDIQLHGHRHMGTLTLDDEILFKEEIKVNKKMLEEHVHGSLVHYCYPSGAHHARQHDWLKALGIKSAVTTEPGVIHYGDNIYTLNRFLDSETLSETEFLAELYGIGNFFRCLFRQRSKA